MGSVVLWHNFVWVAALLVPFNSSNFVFLLLLFTGLFGILFHLFDSEFFVILFSDSLRIITCRRRLVMVCDSTISWIQLAVMNASFDILEMLAIVMILTLLAMVD